MWPFKKRVRYATAREALWCLCVLMNNPKRGWEDEELRSAQRASAEECLALMLQRKPTQEEITEFVELYIPF